MVDNHGLLLRELDEREQHRPGTPSKRDVQMFEGTGFGASTLSDPALTRYSTFERY